jgi:serine/threonine-protein kinase
VGTQVGSFKLVRLLGRGGMGTVYLAEHPVIGSRVAVKFLHESLSENPQVVARFYDEARAVNLIGHENIVAIYDLNLLPPNRYYFVMEYLDGLTLSELARRSKVEARAALEILLQLTDALQCAHDRGVVHRDLKPDNVFLVQRAGRPDFVKLVDFGIAKLRNATVSMDGRTAAGLIVGTPEYMAPEQCDDGTIDARTDVYSLGIIAYELFAGRLPFQGRTVTQLLLAQLQQAPEPPSRYAPGLDASLEREILKALEKDPGARHADMTALGAALRAVLDRLDAAAAGHVLPVPPPAPVAAPIPPPARAPTATASPRATSTPTATATSTATPTSTATSTPTATSTATPTPTSTATPTATPPQRIEPIRVELGGGDAPRHLVAAEVTRAGLFLRAESDLPRLFSRVQLSVSHPALKARLALTGEVVRHVSPAEAEQWHMAPGFAVQLTDLTPERRAALADLAVAFHAGPAAPARAPAERPVADRLADLEARPAATHYGFLGLPPDAEFGEVRRAARELRAQLEAVRARPQAPDQHARATALLARLDTAQHTLSVPAERLRYDAQRGNYLGVARCVAAGIPQGVVEARRREYLAANPSKEKEAQSHLVRAQVARKLKNAPAAVAAFEAALAADPLDLPTLDAYVAFRRESGGA